MLLGIEGIMAGRHVVLPCLGEREACPALSVLPKGMFTQGRCSPLQKFPPPSIREVLEGSELGGRHPSDEMQEQDHVHAE